MLDLPTELASSGLVNVVISSGTNLWHGQAYYAFRDQSLDANLPGVSHSYSRRNQFGAISAEPSLRIGCFFLIGELTKQNFLQPILPGPPFERKDVCLPLSAK